MTEHKRNRSSHRHGDHRPRVGRHQGTEHAAAALVGQDLLRLHRLGDRLLGRVSGLAAGVGATPPACSNYSSRAEVAVELAKLEKIRGDKMVALGTASLADIEKDPALLALARARGKTVFGDNCAPCHGTGGAGAKGYPNLNDDDWLWGGSLDQIMQTIQFGARSGHAEGPRGRTCWPSARTAS